MELARRWNSELVDNVYLEYDHKLIMSTIKSPGLVPEPDLAPTARSEDDVAEQLHGLMHAFRSHLRQAGRGREQALAPMEAKALTFFSRQPGSTAADLVQHSGRDKAQIARLIKPLLDAGLLAREADAADGRSIRLRATDAGRAVHRTMQQQRKRLAARLIEGLSAHELAQLKRLLARMRANLDGT